MRLFRLPYSSAMVSAHLIPALASNCINGCIDSFVAILMAILMCSQMGLNTCKAAYNRSPWWLSDNFLLKGWPPVEEDLLAESFYALDSAPLFLCLCNGTVMVDWLLITVDHSNQFIFTLLVLCTLCGSISNNLFSTTDGKQIIKCKESSGCFSQNELFQLFNI